MAATYDIYTDLSPDELSDVAVEVYRRWLQFALGKEEIGGKTLMHPTGRYAAALKWEKTGVNSVAIIADESAAPEVKWIEEGTVSHSMVDAMLGKGNTKVSADGYRYRVIPMQSVPGQLDTSIASIVGNKKKGQQLSKRNQKVWAVPRAANSDHFAIMSDKPGASKWIVPAMPAYSPARILADLITNKYGKK